MEDGTWKYKGSIVGKWTETLWGAGVIGDMGEEVRRGFLAA